jgi:hypothetical protein
VQVGAPLTVLVILDEAISSVSLTSVQVRH